MESPGALRPLRSRRHFEKSLGQRVRIVRRSTAAGRVVAGVLREVGASGFRLELDGGATVDVPFDDVAEARLDPKLPF